MTTKIDFINAAYSRARISGLTVQPTPEDLRIALDRLEDMAAAWESLNICTGYFFEDTPNPNTPHNVERKYWAAYKSNLAVWLLADFGKGLQPTTTLMMEQKTTFSQISAQTAVVRQTDHPSRQPRGSGSDLRYNRWQRFYRPQAEAPNECATNTMIIGDVNDFVEHFDSYVQLGETVSSYTIATESGLTIVSDSLSENDVSYRIQADGNSSESGGNGLIRVTIVATSSTGRTDTRIINFTLIKNDAN